MGGRSAVGEMEGGRAGGRGCQGGGRRWMACSSSPCHDTELMAGKEMWKPTSLNGAGVCGVVVCGAGAGASDKVEPNLSISHHAPSYSPLDGNVELPLTHTQCTHVQLNTHA